MAFGVGIHRFPSLEVRQIHECPSPDHAASRSVGAELSGMARSGATFEEILKHYYTGITLQQAY
jgi:uncharacterized protein (DUF433 family)